MIKLGIIYGGMSTEHEVSIASAKSVISNLNKNKYEIQEIYITKEGKWLDKEEKTIENVFSYLKSFDVVFPVLHGLDGEDGTIQGLFEMLKVPYVGVGVLGSAVGMDKVYSKIVFEKAGILQAKYVYIKKKKEGYIYVLENFEELELPLKEICKKVSEKIEFPMFVKPSNSGSSIGINKAHNIKELEECIEYAGKFDTKILVEESINAREIECAVLGNDSPKASCIGEVLPADEFYSYEAKYKNAESKTQIPAKISKEVSNKIRNSAVKAYKALDCKGLSRVDFFVEKETEKIYINEINTMPGFTNISMYPKLWEYSGLKYSELLDELIKLALDV